MKLKLIIAAAALSSMGMVGCSKTFLEEPKPTSSIPSSEVYGSDVGVRSYLNGIYRNLRTQWGTSTDAWGITSVNLAREVKGLDVVLPDQNWYSFDYQNDNREPTYRRTVFTWNFIFETVNQANNLIAGVEASGLAPASKAAFLAEGRALRAWAYFELVREFSKAYSQDPNAPGVPIYTVPTTIETRGNPRGKVSDVYALITSDLEFAVANLPTSRQLKNVINKNVANGILARVYLEMGQWEKAKNAAVAARAGFTLNASGNYNTPFTSIDKTEVMWGFPQSNDQTIYYGSPSAFWGLSNTSGYYNFFIDSVFVDHFSATDVRKGTFYRTGVSGPKAFKSSKFGNATNFTDHIIMMRVPEMFLIEAEAKARLGEADAAQVLLQVQKNRDPNAVLSTSTDQPLINEILLERRKELYGEIGVSFLDIKRLGLPYQRSAGHPQIYRLSFPANSPVFTLKIPQVELDANKSLTPADQNP